MISKLNILNSLLVVASFFGLVLGQCDYYQLMSVGTSYQVFSPGYPKNYAAGLSCSWQAVAPTGYKIEINCSPIAIPSTTGCALDSLRISLTGSASPNNDNVYCGSGKITLTSAANALTVRLKTKTNSGKFFCTLKTVYDPCQCGRRNMRRIVGGVQTGVNEFSSVVRLERVLTGALMGTGSIISDSYVLTAAHCLSKVTAAQMQIKVGEHDTSTASETLYTAIYKVSKITRHASFKPSTNQNDIALVMTSKPILFNVGVGPSCLPFKFTSTDFSGSSVIATGWGTLSFGGPLSKTLQKVSLNVISNAQCSSYFSIAYTQICTLIPGRDTCQYDSGGSLFFTGNNGRLYSVGIVSSGLGCGGNTPNINTRVTDFIPWIVKNTPGSTLCNV